MIVSSIHPSPVIHSDNSRTANDFLQRTIESHNPSDAYLLIQRNTSGEVDKREHGVQTDRLPDHLLVSVLKVDSRSAHGEGELGAGIGQREEYGFWHRDELRISGASLIWCLKTSRSEE